MTQQEIKVVAAKFDACYKGHEWSSYEEYKKALREFIKSYDEEKILHRIKEEYMEQEDKPGYIFNWNSKISELTIYMEALLTNPCYSVVEKSRVEHALILIKQWTRYANEIHQHFRLAFPDPQSFSLERQKNFKIKDVTNTNTVEDEWLSVPEVAELLNLKIETIYAKVQKREIPFTKQGRLRFSRKEINEWIASGRRKTQLEINELAEKWITRT